MEALTGLVIAILAFIGGVTDAGNSASAGDAEQGSPSVELGISELSPRGPEGGYAMPASASSNPSVEVRACDLVSGSNGTVLTTSYGTYSGYSWNGTNCTTGTKTISGSQEVEIQWRSNDELWQGSCSATNGAGFSTGGSLAGSDETITEPAAGSSDTFTVSCSTGDSFSTTVNDSVVVEKSLPPPTVNFSACDLGGGGCTSGTKNISGSQEVEITWSSTNADLCTEIAGPGFTTGSGAATNGTDNTVTEPSSGSTVTFTISCANSDASTQKSVQVSKSSVPLPTVSINICNLDGTGCTSGTKNINPNDEVEVTWSSSNADSCTATAGGGFATGGAVNGTDDLVTEPSAGNSSTFTVSCSNAGGSTPASAVVSKRNYQCSNGADDPDVEDTLADANDPGCWTDPTDPATYDPNDDDESDSPQCSDGGDNDGDGQNDFPNDPGCSSSTDDDERDADLVPSNLNYSGTLQEGQTVDLSAQFDNSGFADSGTFSNNFSYCWGSGCTNWTNLTPYIGHANMSPGDPTRTDTYNNFSVTNDTYVRFQYCVDSNLEVWEGAPGSAGESNNCIQTGSLNIQPAPDVVTDIEINVNSTGYQDPVSKSIAVNEADSLQLRWTSQNADSCSATQGGSYGFSTGGATNDIDAVTTPPAGSTNVRFEVTCTGSGNPDSDYIDVTVQPTKPTLSTNCPSIVEIGDQCDFTYDDGGNTNCTLEGPNAGQVVSGNGTVTGVTIEGESTFFIDCDALDSDPVEIRVFPAGGET